MALDQNFWLEKYFLESFNTIFFTYFKLNKIPFKFLLI